MTNILTVAGLLGCLYFVIAYHITTGGDWRRSSAGRHIMQFTANLGALFALIVSVRLFGDWPGRATVTLVLYCLLVGQIWHRCVLLHQAQRRPTTEDATTPRGGPS